MSFWPDYHKEGLRDRLASGMSHSDAAASLNAQFGTSYTRNACIGVANRMGIKSLCTKGRPSADGQPKRLRAKRKSPLKLEPKRPRQPHIDTRPMRCDDVTPLHKSLLELEPGDCRWPYGDNPFTFCGHLSLEGRSYCPAHESLSTDNRGRSPAAPQFTATFLRLRAATSVVLRSSMDHEDPSCLVN